LIFFLCVLSVSLGGIFDPPPGRVWPGAEEQISLPIKERITVVGPGERIEIVEIIETDVPQKELLIEKRPLSISEFVSSIGQFAKNEMSRFQSVVSSKYHFLTESIGELFHKGQKEGEKIYQTGKTTEHKVEDVLRQGKDKAKDIYESGKEKVEEKSETLKRKTEEMYKSGKQKARDLWSSGKEKLQTSKDVAEELYDVGKEKVEEGIDATKGVATSLKEKVKEKAEEGKERMEEAAHTVGSTTHRLYESGKEKLKDILETGKEKLKETVESSKEKVREGAETGKEKLTEVAEDTKTTLENVKGKVEDTLHSGKEYARRVYESVRSTLGDSMEKGKEKLKQVYQGSEVTPYQEIELYWNEFISSIPELSDSAKQRLREEGVRALEKLESQKPLMETKDFERAKQTLIQELEHLEVVFGRKILAVQKRFENLWQRIELAHKTGKIDFNLPHHAIMKCGKCNQEYTFPEFFDMFEEFDYDMMYPDILPSDEKEMEEFYQGWVAWAQHLKLKCKKCGASDWREVVTFDKRHL